MYVLYTGGSGCAACSEQSKIRHPPHDDPTVRSDPITTATGTRWLVTAIQVRCRGSCDRVDGPSLGW
ncbi:MAG: hypothetical protein QGG09_04225, partial [Pirellulaceae bacterium]|nr:hypothetical protein [Pirellulaceae bacterium]